MSVDVIGVLPKYLQVIEDEVQKGRELRINIDTSLNDKGVVVYDFSISENMKAIESDCNLETFEEVLEAIAIGLRK